MIFYHYTCMEHLDKIIDSGYLKLSESNISPEEEKAGPGVVWLVKKRITGKAPSMLTSRAVLSSGGKLVPVTIDKSRVEITVDLSSEEVQRSDKFFRKHKSPTWWVEALEDYTNSKARDWYVIERTIPSEEWIEIKDRYNEQDVIKTNSIKEK